MLPLSSSLSSLFFFFLCFSWLGRILTDLQSCLPVRPGTHDSAAATTTRWWMEGRTEVRTDRRTDGRKTEGPARTGSHVVGSCAAAGRREGRHDAGRRARAREGADARRAAEGPHDRRSAGTRRSIHPARARRGRRQRASHRHMASSRPLERSEHPRHGGPDIVADVPSHRIAPRQTGPKKKRGETQQLVCPDQSLGIACQGTTNSGGQFDPATLLPSSWPPSSQPSGQWGAASRHQFYFESIGGDGEMGWWQGRAGGSATCPTAWHHRASQ